VAALINGTAYPCCIRDPLSAIPLDVRKNILAVTGLDLGSQTPQSALYGVRVMPSASSRRFFDFILQDYKTKIATAGYGDLSSNEDQELFYYRLLQPGSPLTGDVFFTGQKLALLATSQERELVAEIVLFIKDQGGVEWDEDEKDNASSGLSRRSLRLV
jgi:hypothetical protein